MFFRGLVGVLELYGCRERVFGIVADGGIERYLEGILSQRSVVVFVMRGVALGEVEMYVDG